MEQEPIPDFINTQYIIKKHCKKDSFNYVNNLPIQKQRSLYQTSIGSTRNSQTLNRESIQQRKDSKLQPLSQAFQTTNLEDNSLGPISSIYKSSFSPNQKTKAPKRVRQSQSFFLKHHHYELPQSTYHKMSRKIGQNETFYKPQQARKHDDNLALPRYSRAKDSTYKADFNERITQKLPSIYKNKMVQQSSLKLR